MPAINRLEARTDNRSLRAACLFANRTVHAIRNFADNLFDGSDHFSGPTAVQA